MTSRRPTPPAARGHRPTLLLLLLVLTGGCVRGAGTDPPTPRADRSDAVFDPAALEQALQLRIERAPGTVGLALVDLATGATLGLGDTLSMHAASTMKVPVLLELYRQAAEGRWDLEGPVAVRNRFTSIADGSAFSVEAERDSERTLHERIGGATTRAELARLMIVRSSNLATNLLIEEVGADAVRRTLDRLGAPDVVVLRGVEDMAAFERGLNNTTTARGLARTLGAIARCAAGQVPAALAPLTPGGCAAVVDVLTQQEFTGRIPAGLPEGVRVANKTGSITAIDHDAAIVYPPDRAPYVLVVLQRDFGSRDDARQTARDLSRIVWEALAG